MSEIRGKIKDTNFNDIKKFMLNNAIFFVLLGLLVVIVFLEPSFISFRNFKNILAQSSTRVIMALGVGGIIVAKGTDLSLGRVV